MHIKGIHPASADFLMSPCKNASCREGHGATGVLTIPHAAPLHGCDGCASAETCWRGTCKSFPVKFWLSRWCMKGRAAVCNAYQPAVAMAAPTSKKSITTAERTVSVECHNSCPNLQNTIHLFADSSCSSGIKRCHRSSKLLVHSLMGEEPHAAQYANDAVATSRQQIITYAGSSLAH